MSGLRWRMAILGCGVATLWLFPSQVASQEPSLGDIARQARTEKQAQRGPKAKRVWTNDNLPTGPGMGVSVTGSTAPAPSARETEAGPPSGEAPAGGEAEDQEKERQETEAALKAEKQHLDRAKRELELAQREYNLQRQTYYRNTQYASDKEGKAALDSLANQVSAKQQEIQQAQQKIAELEEKLENLHRALGPKKEEPRTTDQEREAWAGRIRPLREELAHVESEIRRINTQTAAQGLTLQGVTTGGSPTGDLLQGLERRRSELQRKIAEIEDEGRRAGVPPAWLR